MGNDNTISALGLQIYFYLKARKLNKESRELLHNVAEINRKEISEMFQKIIN